MSAARAVRPGGSSPVPERPQLTEATELSVTDWQVWSTTVRVVVTKPSAMAAACEIVRDQLRAVDEVANRFREDSEIRRLNTSTGVVQQISPLLADLIGAALDVARSTSGDVDPTVGSALRQVGYDRDINELRRGPAALPSIGGLGSGTFSFTVLDGDIRPEAPRAPRPSWRQVHLNGTRLGLPTGVELDLGATAKAWTSDRCAQRVHEATGSGVLVSLGGDIATAGEAPAGGWQILVEDDITADAPQAGRGVRISIPSGAAVATSSTARRRWVHDGTERHHIINPRTGESALPVWRAVSVVAPSCLQANAWSTAAVVRGRIAPVWLAGLDAVARLVSPSGRVVTIGGWPR